MKRPSLSARDLGIVLGSIAWFGVLLQFYVSLSAALGEGKSMVGTTFNLLSHFTMLTNILVGITLIGPAVAPTSRLAQFFKRPAVVAWVASTILLVGIAYHVWLRNAWNPQGLQLVADTVSHYLTPAAMVSYWWLTMSGAPLRWVHPIFWSAYPAAYCAFVLTRGAMTGNYPYPFIDVPSIGYEQTMVNALTILLGYVVLGAVFVAMNRTRSRVPR